MAADSVSSSARGIGSRSRELGGQPGEQRAEGERDRRVVRRLGRCLGDRLQVRSSAASDRAGSGSDPAWAPAAAGRARGRAGLGWVGVGPCRGPTPLAVPLTRPRRPGAPRNMRRRVVRVEQCPRAREVKRPRGWRGARTRAARRTRRPRPRRRSRSWRSRSRGSAPPRSSARRSSPSGSAYVSPCSVSCSPACSSVVPSGESSVSARFSCLMSGSSGMSGAYPRAFAAQPSRRGLRERKRNERSSPWRASWMARRSRSWSRAEGIEQVELTEPWKAVEEAGGKPELISIESGEIQAFNHLDKADTFSVDKTVARRRRRRLRRPRAARAASRTPTSCAWTRTPSASCAASSRRPSRSA